MNGFTTAQVAEALGVSPSQVRSWARSGLLDPARDGRGAYRFSFQDLVILRTARELRDQAVPARRVRAALRSLKEQLPRGRPLSTVRVTAEGSRVVVRGPDAPWEPSTGQLTLDFPVEELAARVEPLLPALEPTRGWSGKEEPGPDDWYDLAYDLEAISVEKALAAYRRAIDRAPDHVEAHLNLGRLLHEGGELEAAESHYRQALAADPGSALAAYNLGVVLEDRDDRPGAMGAYRRALEADPDHAESHYNLARLCEEAGERTAAVRHLAEYRRLRSG